MIRTITLIHKAISSHEPVLLIGDTGTGKTISVEFLSEFYNRKLITVNCHENMDTNDFLGSLRSNNSNSSQNGNNNSLFEWVDGPLTEAMKKGHILLIDEISLVMDSVLERMNSVFEADSVLVLSEKNISEHVEIIKPHNDFIVIAAMTPPKGEYGKKELSNALRARFTEIYIGDIEDDDVNMIIEYKVSCIKGVDCEWKRMISEKLIEVFRFYNGIEQIQKPMTFRDVDIICEFIENNLGKCIQHDNDNNESNYYDLILTGDLSTYGKDIVKQILIDQYGTCGNYEDCGLLIYDLEKQDVFAGGSGCACCALVTYGYILNQIEKETLVVNGFKNFYGNINIFFC